MKTKILLLPAAFVIIVLGARNCITSDQQDTLLPVHPAIVLLDWPSVGQAAVGTVKKGLLTGSPGEEELSPVASIAKIITALAVMEKQPFTVGEQGPTYTITTDDMTRLRHYLTGGGSVLPLKTGMKMTRYQAMQRMLIGSDNYAADILAERIFGSQSAYVLYAQDMLRRMGLSRTIVADASGFSAVTASTASELIALGIAVLKEPVIAGIVGQHQARVPLAGMIKNTNQLLGSYGVIGIKTGTTSAAGSCLLFAAPFTASNGQPDTLVGVIIGDRNHPALYRDSKTLLASAKQWLTTRNER